MQDQQVGHDRVQQVGLIGRGVQDQQVGHDGERMQNQQVGHDRARMASTP